MNLYITENESMLILIYPDGQRLEVDHFLRPVDFKDPQGLIGTHCVDAEIVSETIDTSTIRYIKSPQQIQETELVKLDDTTEGYFAEIISKHKEFVDQSKVIQILNLYCAFDDAVCACPEKDLILAEKIAFKA